MKSVLGARPPQLIRVRAFALAVAVAGSACATEEVAALGDSGRADAVADSSTSRTDSGAGEGDASGVDSEVTLDAADGDATEAIDGDSDASTSGDAAPSQDASDGDATPSDSSEPDGASGEDASVSMDASDPDDSSVPVPDSGSELDATDPDANPDGAPVDASGPDATLDASGPDATLDASAPDAAPDATVLDSGPADVGFTDAGFADATPDAGPPDTGYDGGYDAGYDGGTLQDFCTGVGSVVQVGGGGECSGTIAQNTFRFALCTCEDFEASSNLSVDAFDSRVGPHGGANIIDDGDIGVNGTMALPGKLTELGSVFVSGGGFAVGGQSRVTRNVFAAGDATGASAATHLERNVYLGGNVTGRFDIAGDLILPAAATIDPATTVAGQILRQTLPPIEPCACAPSELLDIHSFVAFGAQFNDNAEIGLDADTWATGTGPSQLILPCGRYYLRGIHHPSSLELRATGRTVLYVDGDFEVQSSLRVEIDPGAELDIFITGSLIPGASLRFGDESQPSKVRTYVAGGGAIALSGSSVFGGNLYAPRAYIQFNSAATLYGAIFGRFVRFDASSEVHFDSAIRSEGETCEPPAPDAGTDAGTDDAGAAPPDASTPDAGALVDAGSADAGASGDAAVDGGTPPAACSKCYDCAGTLACIKEPNQTIGACGPCTTDLDCCAGEICVAGECLGF